jgi:hypothetical protein
LKFAVLQFADQPKEICGLAYLRNLRTCDCGLSPRICGFKKIVARPSLQICHRDTGAKLPLVLTALAVNLPPVSMVVHLEL